MINVQSQIEAELALLNPIFMRIENESNMHSGPATDSHFKITMVADVFNGLRAVARHQKVYASLANQLAGPVHALALHLYSPDEWSEEVSVPNSPTCKGGSKHD